MQDIKILNSELSGTAELADTTTDFWRYEQPLIFYTESFDLMLMWKKNKLIEL